MFGRKGGQTLAISCHPFMFGGKGGRNLAISCQPFMFDSKGGRSLAISCHSIRRANNRAAGMHGDDPTYCRIMREPLGIIHIFVTGEPSEDRLPQHTDQVVPAIPPMSASCNGSAAAAVRLRVSSSSRETSNSASEVTDEP